MVNNLTMSVSISPNFVPMYETHKQLIVGQSHLSKKKVRIITGNTISFISMLHWQLLSNFLNISFDEYIIGELLFT